jgi:hypothetical protein
MDLREIIATIRISGDLSLPRQGTLSPALPAVPQKTDVRIPIHSGRVFRFEAGRDSEMKPAT